MSDIISESNSATNLLFTYGTLQDEQIQLSLFSRKLKDTKDALANYKLSDKKVTDSYPTIRYTGNSIDILEGKVYVLTHKELMLADSYEGIAYRRIEVVLMSGKKTWVYVENEI
ncbi:MAG: gamma-glutamylcyclotransferase family protein [Maribacter sp.]